MERKKWTPEMIRALFKDERPSETLPELTKGELAAMMAICRLAQRQTEDELLAEETKHDNGRGFSQAHAKAATDMADYMTEGKLDGRFRRPTYGATEYGVWQDSGRPRIWSRRKLALMIASRYCRQLAEIANEQEAKKAG